MNSGSKKISFEDLASKLEINPSKLSYIIYKLPDNKKYFHFEIPKKTGGKRRISKPVPKLMSVQRKVKDYLLTFYISKPCSHGFEINRNIKTNAERHQNGKLLLNIDIKDFFGSIIMFKYLCFSLDLKSPFKSFSEIKILLTLL